MFVVVRKSSRFICVGKFDVLCCGLQVKGWETWSVLARAASKARDLEILGCRFLRSRTSACYCSAFRMGFLRSAQSSSILAFLLVMLWRPRKRLQNPTTIRFQLQLPCIFRCLCISATLVNYKPVAGVWCVCGAGNRIMFCNNLFAQLYRNTGCRNMNTTNLIGSYCNFELPAALKKERCLHLLYHFFTTAKASVGSLLLVSRPFHMTSSGWQVAASS